MLLSSSHSHTYYKVLQQLTEKLFLRVNQLSRHNIIAPRKKKMIGIGRSIHCNRISQFQHAQLFVHVLMLLEKQMFKTSLKFCVTGFKKKIHTEISYFFTDADNDCIIDEIESQTKLILNVLQVVIVTSDSIGVKFNKAILYVGIIYIFIKYQYIN